MKNRTIWVGDLHFDDSQPWSLDRGDAFIDWFINSEFNCAGTDLVLTGDIVDKFHASPLVVDQAIRFFSGLRTRVAHVVVGNHDVKYRRNDYYTGLEFLRKRPGMFKTHVEVYSYPKVVDLRGLSWLVLPHYEHGAEARSLGLPPMKDMYENPPESLVQPVFDVGTMHANDETYPLPGHDSFINLSKFKVKKWVHGDIHLRVNDRYVGTPYPTKISEAGCDRYIEVYDHDSNIWQSYKLPTFLEYHVVEYPGKAPEAPGIRVLKVLNCPNTDLAKEYYPGVFIHSAVPSVELDIDVEQSASAGDDTDSLDYQSAQVVQQASLEFVRDTAVDPEIADTIAWSFT